MKITENISSSFQYWGTKGMIRLIRLMPYHAALTLGRSIMVIVWALMPLRRKIVRIQMEAALGLNNPWRLALKVFMNQGDILIDAIKYSYMSTDEIRKRITVEGKENLDAALASKRGLMMFTGHISNWEVLSHTSRLLNVEFCIMADVRKDPRLEAVIDGVRARAGATILPPKGKALMLIKELKKGKTIGFVVDQRGRPKDGLLCSIFGLPAPTNPAPAFIAIKGDALVQPVYIVKQKGRYRICIMKAVDSRDFAEGDEAIQKLSDFMQSFVASVAQQYPDQWFWLHSRWIRRKNLVNVKTAQEFKAMILAHADGIRSHKKPA
jgi:Kdo2-lipid IVA lauroyltransferase/acyltransferase